MVSTVYHRTPPVGYGGIERVVHILVEELVRQGHDVTLFATPGSHCSGRTEEIAEYDPACAPSGIRNSRDALSEEPLFKAIREYLARHPADVIHDWSFDNLFVRRCPHRIPFVISTCVPQRPGYVRRNLVACSAAHARALGGDTRYIHYGLRLDDWQFSLKKQKHLIHIAKIARYKGQHEAVAAAWRAGRDLLVVGNVEDRTYHLLCLRPLILLSGRARYLGETKATNPLLREAACLVQTPKWFDALPLVVLEAFASGTPVIAYNRGGLAEQIEHGVNGFLCNSFAEMVMAIRDLDSIDPRNCLRTARERFSVERFARQYVELYRRVGDGEAWVGGAAHAEGAADDPDA
jgi:glycosyltransferase involved in cell wall biosynthesis